MDKEFSARIIAAARKYVGTPWMHQGRVTSLDCVGLALAVAEDLGLRDREGKPILRVDYMNYARQPRDNFLDAECARRLIARPLAELAPGMLAILRAPLCHAGIVASVAHNGVPEYLTLIHAHAVHKIAEHRIDEIWRSRIVACFSFPQAPLAGDLGGPSVSAGASRSGEAS